MSNNDKPTQTMGASQSPTPNKSGAKANRPELPGHLVSGRRLGPYEIVAEVGRGGMGVVFKAHDTALHRDIALKLVPANVANEEEKLARFLREARSAAKLQHPAIVPIYFAGQEDGIAFIAMGFVDGRTLSAVIDTDAPMAPAKAVRIIRDLADALNHAHERGIIHRDVKPDNIMLATDGTVRIMDFGLARSYHVDAGKITDTGIYLGTPVYSSPEQVKAGPMDGRSDIYSLGIVFYELVTRQTPFHADSPYKIFHAIVNDDPVPPGEVNPLLPPPVAGVIEKMIAKDPDDRYASAAEVVEDCQKLLKVLDGSARLAVSSETVTLPRPSNRLLTAAQRTQQRLRRMALAVAGVVVVIAAAVAVALAPSSTPDTPGPSTAHTPEPPPPAPSDPAQNGASTTNPTPTPPVPAPMRTLVVLRNFENLNGLERLDWLRPGIPVMLGRGLSDANFLNIVSRDEQDRAMMRLGLKDLDDPAQFQIMVAELGADVVIRGHFLAADNGLHIVAQISDVRGGVTKGGVWINGAEKDVFKILADLSEMLRSKLDELYNGSQQVIASSAPPTAVSTPDPAIDVPDPAQPQVARQSAMPMHERMLATEVDGKAISEAVRAAKDHMFAQLPQEYRDAGSSPAAPPIPGGFLPLGDDPYDEAVKQQLQRELEEIESVNSQLGGRSVFAPADAPLGFDHLFRMAEREKFDTRGVIDMSVFYQEVAKVWNQLQEAGHAAWVQDGKIAPAPLPHAHVHTADTLDPVRRQQLELAFQFYTHGMDHLVKARAYREAEQSREMAVELHQAMLYLIRCLMIEPRFGPALDELRRLQSERWDAPQQHHHQLPRE